jgi:hypothetical protein
VIFRSPWNLWEDLERHWITWQNLIFVNLGRLRKTSKNLGEHIGGIGKPEEDGGRL